MTVLKYLLAVAMAMLIFTGCGPGSDAPSDKIVEEVIQNILTGNNPRCSRISNTLSVDIDNRFDPVETDQRGTHYDVRAKVNFYCFNNDDEPTEYTDTYRFRKSGIGSHPSGWHAQPLLNLE